MAGILAASGDLGALTEPVVGVTETQDKSIELVLGDGSSRATGIASKTWVNE